MAKHPLKGSTRAPLPGAHATGKADPDERLEVTLILRRRAPVDFADRVKNLTEGDQPEAHLTREEFAEKFGADPADIAIVEKFAAEHALHVVQKDSGRRTVMLSGSVAEFEAAFTVELQNFEHDDGSYRGRVGDVMLPDELNGVVEAVMGLDNRPQARSHFRRHSPPGNVVWRAASAQNPTSFSPVQIASLYQFPEGGGAGQTIAIIELGGGYRKPDLKTYFAKYGVKTPKITSVSVDHARNHPTGDANGPDGEVMLDIEVVGAVAPDAKIVVYFAPNTDSGFLNAITTAIHDTKHNPQIISISWGGPESSWTEQSMTAFDEAFQSAATLGVTVIAASGDNGSADGVTSGGAHVDFPASSPHVLGAGGTRLAAANGVISGETVWNEGAQGGAGGGGVSAFFALPDWQKGLQVTATGGAKQPLAMRGVPDISGDADPESGYDVRVDGSDTVIGGTSAVAPLWAGLIARINALTKKSAGFVNPLLYQHPAALNDITSGNNGAFQAAPGWDATTGLGTPNGKALLAALTGPVA